MRLAAGEALVSHAVTLHDFFKGNGAVFTIANSFQRTFGQIYVLEIIQVLQDCFADVIALGAPSAASQSLKTLFDRLRKPDGQHLRLPI